MTGVLDLGVQPAPIATFDTSFGSAGADPFGSIAYPVPPVGSSPLALDPFLFPETSAGSDSTLFPLASDPNGLLYPVQPAPQNASAGSPAGDTWAPLLGFGAAVVNSDVTKQVAQGTLQPGNLQITRANGASVGTRGSGGPLRTLFDTTNQGVTGKTLVFGAVALLAIVYAIRKLT